MSQLDNIKKVIADKFIALDQKKLLEDKVPDGSHSIIMERNILSEKGIDYVLYRFDPDKDGDIFPFFERTTGLKMICDYILIVEIKEKIYCLLIELKSGISSYAKKQLEASSIFMNYILNSAERIGCKIENHQIRKIRISGIKSKGKRATKPKELEYDKDSYAEYNITGDFRMRPLLK
ncbi:MAG: hypothetical protein LBR34_09390 [Prevotella sp.]|jgi:hypothetical protein|nr:hypothetical protein [Prevotella sp.]